MAKILVVDDLLNIRELVGKVLKTEGFDVVTVPTASQGLEKIFSEPFDLVVLDIEIGEDNGIDVLKKVREKNKNLPIVIYSAAVTPEIETECMSAGADDVLRKDVGVTLLVKQISTIVNAKDRLIKGESVKKEKPVLIIDDQDNIRQFLKTFFGKKGYEIVEANCGEQGVEIVQSQEVAVVLCDVQMTGIDGIETLKRIKEIKPNLGVVMATGEQDDELITRALELGAYGYVLKPFDFVYLELVVMSKLTIAEGE